MPIEGAAFERKVLSGLGYTLFADTVQRRSMRLSDATSKHLHGIAKKRFGWRRPGGFLSILSFCVLIASCVPVGVMLGRHSEPEDHVVAATWITAIAGSLSFVIAACMHFRPIGRGAYLPFEVGAVLLAASAIISFAAGSETQRIFIIAGVVLSAITALVVAIRRLMPGPGPADTSAGFDAVIATAHEWFEPRLEELKREVTAEFAAGPEAEHLVTALRLRTYELLASEGFDTSKIQLDTPPAIPIVDEIARTWVRTAQAPDPAKKA